MTVYKLFNEIPSREYGIVYADPPWLYYGDPNKDQAAGKHYKCMSFDELAALDVKRIIAKTAVVLMWTTASQFENSINLLRAWGTPFRSVFKVWAKTNSAGQLIHGQGIRPTFIKPTAEFVIAGSTQKKGRPFKLFSEAMPFVDCLPRPSNVHSRKPDKIRHDIDALFPRDVRRIELFARRPAEGWDCFGNEVEENMFS